SLSPHHRAKRSQEGGIRAYLPEVCQCLGAVRIVEGEHRRLRKGIRSSETGGMVRIPLDFCRAPLVAFREDPSGDASERHCRGEIQRLSGKKLFRLANVGSDRLHWLSRTGAQTCQGKRSPHQPQKPAPPYGIVPLRREPGKFPVQHFIKTLGLGQFLETTPVIFATCVAEPLLNSR